MSKENVEIVRRHIEAYARADVEAALEPLDPEVVLDASPIGAVGSLVSGSEEVSKEVGSYIGAFEDYEFELRQLIDAGGDKVVGIGTETGRGKGSGVLTERSVAILYIVRRGKITRIVSFPDEATALEAAGLSEDDAHSSSS